MTSQHSKKRKADSDEGYLCLRFDDNVGSSTTSSSSVTLAQLSEDGRHIREEHVTFTVPPSSPTKNLSTSSVSPLLQANWELGPQLVPGFGILGLNGDMVDGMSWSEDVFGSEEPILVEAPPQARRYTSS
ncbi:hypothetical protein V5O48_018538, partial [Marasmius crinis-equi]